MFIEDGCVMLVGSSVWHVLMVVASSYAAMGAEVVKSLTLQVGKP